jgi:hypothetical protein
MTLIFQPPFLKIYQGSKTVGIIDTNDPNWLEWYKKITKKMED